MTAGTIGTSGRTKFGKFVLLAWIAVCRLGKTFRFIRAGRKNNEFLISIKITAYPTNGIKSQTRFLSDTATHAEFN